MNKYTNTLQHRKTTNRNLPVVAVYTHSLLAGSMTFIKTQAEDFDRHTAVYVGAHRVKGIGLPADRTLVVNNGGPFGILNEALFRKMNFAPGMIKRLGKRNPVVIHTHFGTCGPAGMTIADALNIPLIVTFHGQDATIKEEDARKSFRGRDLLANKNRLIERTNKFIAVSNHIRECLLAQGYPDEKIIVHYNGINLETFKPKPQEKTDPLILFVGRFVEKKGIKYLLEAAKQLQKQEVLFELVLVGSGPLEQELKLLADELGVSCTFTGFLDPDEIRTWICRARVVAVPSVVAEDGDSEGLPTILLEAQAMATPVVGTRHSGIPEGVIEGQTAELVAEKDVDALASKLRLFLNSPETSSAYGKAARAFVVDNFDMKVQNAKLEELFETLRSD